MHAELNETLSLYFLSNTVHNTIHCRNTAHLVLRNMATALP